MSNIETPQFDLPFRFVGVDVAYVEQDTLQEISDCVQVICSTRVGQRLELPAFGIPDQAFTVGGQVDASLIVAAVQQWEPRATIAATAQGLTIEQYVAGILINVEAPQ